MRIRTILLGGAFPAILLLQFARCIALPRTESSQSDSEAKARTLVDLTPAELTRVLPDLQGLQPVENQDELPGILEKVGQAVEKFFHGFPNTSSVEQIHEEQLKRNGKSMYALDEDFEYLCLTSNHKWGLGIEEYRRGLAGGRSAEHGPDDRFMLTSGFASASIRFHPSHQAESRFRLLGRQTVEGRERLVLAFAQRPEAGGLSTAFRMSRTSVTTYAQGVAWIVPPAYEIVRMRTDLLTPVPRVRLEKLSTEITYGEVRFKNSPAGLWLPSAVTVTVDWNGKLLRNTHNYAQYKLFNVATKEKRSARKLAEGDADDSD